MAAFAFPILPCRLGRRPDRRFARAHGGSDSPSAPTSCASQREATAALAVEIDRERLASELDFVVRSRLQEMIGLASAGKLTDTAGRKEVPENRGAGPRVAGPDAGRCSACYERSTEVRGRPDPRSSSSTRCSPGARAGGRVVDLEVEGEHRPLTVGRRAGGVSDGSARARRPSAAPRQPVTRPRCGTSRTGSNSKFAVARTPVAARAPHY